MTRDYGDMTLREKAEKQIEILDECIAKLGGSLRSGLVELRDAAQYAHGVLRGSQTLLREIIPHLP